MIEQIDTKESTAKIRIIDQLHQYITNCGLNIVEENTKKPWGAYFKLDKNNITEFINNYFEKEKGNINTSLNLDPKFLLVAPHQRLSWQYHFRRSEIWTVLAGPVAVNLSKDNTEQKVKTKNTNDVIKIETQERHRLIGLDTWGIVAEIWVHTDNTNPSDESDIIRVQDDFGR